MTFVPVGSQIQAESACERNGGLEHYTAVGEERYIDISKLHIWCKDGTKWIREYSSTDADHLAELYSLRDHVRMLDRQLEESKRLVCDTTNNQQ